MLVCYFDKTGSEIGVRINGPKRLTSETDYDNNLRTPAGMNIIQKQRQPIFGGKTV